MAVQETTQGADAKDARIKELTEENELLFEQLHVVQEELEKYYHKLKECKQRKGSNADAGGTVVVIPPQVGEALAENLLSPRGIKWEIKSRGAMAEFAADDSVCVILYRMTRELLINVIKHSGAKHAKVIVNRGVGKIMVAVEDDGHGFPPEFELDSCVSKSFGLFSIRERLAPVGGELKIVSVPGEGATVAMSCPLHLKEGGLNR